jgi:hypothetical protein
LPDLDPNAELARARAQYQAIIDLGTLPSTESTSNLLTQMLGPATATKEIFATLDQQYREQGKPAVWFLPLDEPIAPHLDELLGPIKVK